MGRWVSGRTRVAREANAGLTAVLQEQLAGLRVLRLFGVPIRRSPKSARARRRKPAPTCAILACAARSSRSTAP